MSAFNVTIHTYPDNYSLLDSAASVHVFRNKARFANFKRAGRKANLLCGQNVVKIHGWGDISLPLRVGNRVSLLVLKNVAFVPNFPLNLVSLSCLEDQGLVWNHASGEICNNAARIIGYTTRNGNNYEIGNSDSVTGMGSALMTLAMTSRRGYVYGQKWKKGMQRGRNNTFNKTANSVILSHKKRPGEYSCQVPLRGEMTSATPCVDKSRAFDEEHRSLRGHSIQTHRHLHAPASPDTWHRRMGHIGPLGLYKLGKECLGVQLRGKSMSQCPHCALSKISQQISRQSPANKSTRPFHRVFVDWQDLEEGWDTYQDDGAIVRRAMVVICEAKGMAITYFTQSTKEDKNLPLTRTS